jgi:hypothetical protein
MVQYCTTNLTTIVEERGDVSQRYYYFYYYDIRPVKPVLKRSCWTIAARGRSSILARRPFEWGRLARSTTSQRSTVTLAQAKNLVKR